APPPHLLQLSLPSPIHILLLRYPLPLCPLTKSSLLSSFHPSGSLFSCSLSWILPFPRLPLSPVSSNSLSPFLRSDSPSPHPPSALSPLCPFLFFSLLLWLGVPSLPLVPSAWPPCPSTAAHLPAQGLSHHAGPNGGWGGGVPRTLPPLQEHTPAAAPAALGGGRRGHCLSQASVLCPSRHGLHSWLHRLHLLHWLSSAYTQFAVPYFIYDIYAMFLCHWHKHQVKGHGDEAGAKAPGSTWAVARGYLHKEFLMVLHHAVMVLVCFPLSVVWRQGKGDFFLGCLLMAEVSTPFVCLGKILIQYKQQHTLLHKVNGALMLLSFLCCRVLLFPYLYWAYGRHAGLPLFAVPLAIPAHVNLGAALLLAPQLYWFFLICRGACRLFRPRGTPPPSPCQTKD
uniref:TLC domain containing 3B n=1 Tax=Equus asinus TaxID=9793 RepID=A0A9L0IJ14_EQUAS